MPHFVFRGTDAPDSHGLRARLREEHRAYIRQPASDCRTVLGGPLLAEPDGRMYATLLVFDATDRAAVERFVARDPYMLAGLFAAMTIELWHWGLGQPAPPEDGQRG